MDSASFPEVLSRGLDMKAGSPSDGKAAAEALVASGLSLIDVARKAPMPQKKLRHR